MKINQDNMIITIDTELCANGEKIAKELADMLHLPCYGEEILDKASELSGIPARLMHRYDGRAVHAAYDLLANDHDPLHIRPAADFITAQVAAYAARLAFSPDRRKELQALLNCSPAVLETREKAMSAIRRWLSEY